MFDGFFRFFFFLLFFSTFSFQGYCRQPDDIPRVQVDVRPSTGFHRPSPRGQTATQDGRFALVKAVRTRSLVHDKPARHSVLQVQDILRIDNG